MNDRNAHFHKPLVALLPMVSALAVVEAVALLCARTSTLASAQVEAAVAVAVAQPAYHDLGTTSRWGRRGEKWLE